MTDKLMDYIELSKKLKDAGFPRNSHSNAFYGLEGKDAVYRPNLSELIESCGVSFGELTFGLEFTGVFWECGYRDPVHKTQTYFSHHANGKSPEETVANLWLKIHNASVEGMSTNVTPTVNK